MARRAAVNASRARACAEDGDSECQAYLAKVWAGKFDPNLRNHEESARWAQAAALQGHRGGMAVFSGYLCIRYPRNMEAMDRYAVEAIAWTMLDLESLGRDPIDNIRICSLVAHIKHRRPETLGPLMEAGMARAEELRKAIPRPWHGEPTTKLP